jgi:AcrR family transcriptional regulator
MGAAPRTIRRTLPADQRLEDLLQAATAVLSRKSYRQAQVADVAHEMGVSVGTVYNYVEGKAALLPLVLRHALDGDLPSADALPVKAQSLDQTVNWLRGRLNFVSDFPALEAALARRRAGDVRAEVGGIALELYDVLVRVRVVVALLERSGAEVPDLGELFQDVRAELFARMTRYVELRRRVLRPVGDPEVAARLIIEATSWAALRRPRDHLSTHMDEQAVRDGVQALAVHLLVPDEVANR